VPLSSQEPVVPATAPALPTPDIDVPAPEVPENSGTAAAQADSAAPITGRRRSVPHDPNV
jgi:hypothetical protein